MIAKSDVFVVYDEVQYTKRDWRNRNIIKTEVGKKWLTIPVMVKGKFFQRINETEVADAKWTEGHLMQIKQAYAKAPFFKANFPWVEDLYHEGGRMFLTDINIHFVKRICEYLEITTRIIDSRELNLEGDRNERLVYACVKLKADIYLSGPAAKVYLDEGIFSREGIAVDWMDYSGYPEYEQLYPPFEHGVSILDLLFNVEKEEIKHFMKYL
jgi:hypothetical protein